MKLWTKSLNTIYSSDSPIEEALTIVFNCLGKTNWQQDKILDSIINNDELNNDNTYNNQYKAGALIFSCFYLLQHEINKGFEQHLITLILASIFHNYHHKGHVNKYTYENEKIAVEYMYKFAKKNNLSKHWQKNSWLGIKHMPSWINLSDAIEEIILVSDLSDINKIKHNYIKQPDLIWRSDVPLKINRLKQIFLEALLLPNSMDSFAYIENKKMLLENGKHLSDIQYAIELKKLLDNFLSHIYISQASKNLNIVDKIQNFINSGNFKAPTQNYFDGVT